MDCPQCHTANPALAERCQRCDTPFDPHTYVPPDAAVEIDSDIGATVDNWSAAITARDVPGDSSAGPQIAPGTILESRYEIQERLGGGGMGTVYKAYDREVDRFVAVKVIRPDLAGSPEILSRFKQELILARKVTHKNVIRIFDLGRASGIRFITMEYIEGQDLRSLVKQRGTLPFEESVEIVQQVCLALEAAHNEGVVHRDLKPQNIMVDAQARVLVMDFGIARSVGGEGMTATGGLIGTPEYMSPEQVKGEHVDGKSDIFTFGIIFYELLTGKMPYPAKTAQQSMYRRTLERAIPPIESDSSIPRFLSDVVSKCLEINPQNRYQTARELWADLERWRQGQASSLKSTLMRWSRQGTQSRAGAAALAVILLALMGGIFLRKGFFRSSRKSVDTVPSVSLAVFPFRNASGDSKLDWLGSSISEMLTNDVGQSAQLRTVSAARVSQIFHDLRIASDARLDTATVDRVTEFSNADIVVWGEYARFGELMRVDATLLNKKNGRQIQLKAEAASEKEILKTVDILAKDIRQNLALSSRAISELQTKAFKPSSTSLPALRFYSAGVQLSHDGKIPEALEQFKSSIKEDPEFALGYSRLAGAYAKMGEDDQAQAASLKAMELTEKVSPQEKLLITAANARILQQYPKAIEDYEALAKSSPGDAYILFELAGVYEASGALDQARSYFAKVHELDPKGLDALVAQGRVELESGNWEKGLEFLNTALNLTIQAGNDEQRADVLQAMGVGYENINKMDVALRSYQDSLEIKKRLGLKSGIAASLNAIATVQSGLGNSDLALKNYEESLKLRREIGDKGGIGDVLIDLGTFNVDRGRQDQALKLFKESLQLETELGNEPKRGLLLNNIGNIYLSQGDYQDAQTYFEQALQLRQKFHVPSDIAETLHNLAETAMDLGKYDQALSQYHEALDLRRKANDKRIAAIESYSMGHVFGLQGRYAAALSAQEDALQTFKELGDQSFWMVEILTGYGSGLGNLGRIGESQKSLDEAMGMARGLKNSDLISEIQGYQGDNAFYSADYKSAHRFYAQAVQSAAHSSDRKLVLSSKINLAKVSLEERHFQGSVQSLQSLVEESNRSGLKYLWLQASIYLAKAFVETRKFDETQKTLENVTAQSDRLGLRVLSLQSHALLAQLYGKTNNAEAGHQLNQAQQIWADIRQEAHIDLQGRADLTRILSSIPVSSAAHAN